MAMQHDLDMVVRKKLANAVAKEIDIGKLAKQVAPSVAHGLKSAIIKAAKDFRAGDLVYDALEKDAYKEINKIFVRALRKMK